VSHYDKALLAGFFFPYFAALGLYYFMLFKTSRQTHRSLLDFFIWKDRRRLAEDCKRLYRGSFLYSLTLCCAVACFLTALAVFGLRFWEYAAGR
jgi:hypothetical protein